MFLTFFNILTCKCASRYSGVQIFHIPTSKNAPRVRCFVHFDLQMCFAPQRRAIFRHLNFQKRSGMDVFEHFDLECASRHSGVPFLDIRTSKSGPPLRSLVHFYLKCASRHSGVHFFLSALSSHLRTRRFSEPTFRPSRHTNHWKNTAFRDSLTFRATGSSLY